MILYDLKCHDGHLFEAWFRDSDAFDEQRKARAVACPDCGGTKVEKALMAPNVAAKKGAAADRAVDAGKAKQALMMMSKLREVIEQNCDNVGPEFAEEARRIHYGEVESHNIYGEAAREEAEALREEGIEIAQIPWIRRPDA